ncbi:hypothetical protein Tco_1133167 [Tanacetum coccineum]|uniref:FBD domain-containing protein n=1 Tax=Tanacetum coccineum TaxID=301880 RepID=A0ABQ5JEL6_9ASTR
MDNVTTAKRKDIGKGTVFGLRGAKKLKRGSLYLYVGNGVRAEVEVIGSFDLVLPKGLIIVLDNCHYAPSITSSKQSTTAQHAREAEYIDASEAAKEAVWIRKFIDELGVVPSNDYPIKMNCDNSAAIIIAKELGIQKCARHFQRKYHYVRECIKTGKIDIVKVHTDENLADPFTKALAGPKLTRHARSTGVRPASSFIFAKSNKKEELDFVKLILAKSPVLKKVKLILREEIEKDEELQITRVLLPSPRASPLVKIVVKHGV